MTTPLPSARVQHRFDLSPERVFASWLEPNDIGRWMFGPNVRDEQIVALTVDPRVGGRFSFVVRRGSLEPDHVGTYQEITPPRRLVFTWAVVVDGKSDGETVVEIDIQPVEGGTQLTLTHKLAPSWADFTEQAAQAWAKMLDALAEHVRDPSCTAG